MGVGKKAVEQGGEKDVAVDNQAQMKSVIETRIRAIITKYNCNNKGKCQTKGRLFSHLVKTT